MIYLSASYGRQAELRGYRDQLVARGHEVVSRWLDTEHPDAAGPGGTPEQCAGWATDDLEDLWECETFITFTDGGMSRGGRNVELGYAIGLNMRIVVIGPAENIFHWLDVVERFESWDKFLETM